VKRSYTGGDYNKKEEEKKKEEPLTKNDERPTGTVSS